MDDFKLVQERIKSFNHDRDWEQFHNPKDLLIALMSEVGELADLYRWLTPDEMKKVQEDPEKFAKIKSELADIFSFAFMLAYTTGVDVKSTILEKYALLENRYPVEKAKGVHSNVLEGFKG